MATAEEDGSLVCCDERRALRAELAEVRAQIQILKGEALIKGGSNRLLREELADLHSRAAYTPGQERSFDIKDEWFGAAFAAVDHVRRLEGGS